MEKALFRLFFLQVKSHKDTISIISRLFYHWPMTRNIRSNYITSLPASIFQNLAQLQTLYVKPLPLLSIVLFISFTFTSAIQEYIEYYVEQWYIYISINSYTHFYKYFNQTIEICTKSNNFM